MLNKTKLALVAAILLGSTAFASAQTAIDRPDFGYSQQQQNNVQSNPNKNVGENGGA